MSTSTLTNLRDYLTGTLSPDNMIWLATQLTEYAKKEEQSRKPYTIEEIRAMIVQSERDIAEGRIYDFDEAMDELEKEFAEEDRELAMAEAIWNPSWLTWRNNKFAKIVYRIDGDTIYIVALWDVRRNPGTLASEVK